MKTDSRAGASTALRTQHERVPIQEAGITLLIFFKTGDHAASGKQQINPNGLLDSIFESIQMVCSTCAPKRKVDTTDE
jgi:hypothetical protein